LADDTGTLESGGTQGGGCEEGGKYPHPTSGGSSHLGDHSLTENVFQEARLAL